VSRVGKKPVVIPDGVKITQEGNFLKIKGPKGELERQIHPNIGIEIVENQVNVTRPNDTKQNKSLHGLSRALVQNMVTGVTDTYKKTLDIVGVGYKAELKGKNLLLNIGYSHPIFLIPPEGITLEIPTQTQIIVSGIDKQLVGLIAAKIRSFRKPEPYKGKGIKYSDEHIVRKAGKTAG
jgi:large subunit ribosomal protein L6